MEVAPAFKRKDQSARRVGSFLRFVVIPLLVLAASLHAADETQPQRVYRIMPVGDSITAGGSTFSVYRYPLWEKLHAAGYLMEYVGSQKSESRVGTIEHEGYGGKNIEFLAETVPAHFAKQPADIVLIHAGHNHDVQEKPIPGIVAATESLIASFRKTNPKVIVLLAQVVTSGKLPKYSYIPELNRELEKLAARLNNPTQPVVLVGQASGFDWTKDTIADKVHPNALGADKMAGRWLEALTKLMEKPPASYSPKLVTYKQAGETKLTLHVFNPGAGSSAKPAIVFFFGGGWKVGTPVQFYHECAHFAAKGMVAISADYRIASVNKTTPFESVADARSAIRYVRQHAAELGIDPHRIVAAGASAGGQLAAATGTLKGLDEPGENQSISSRPDAMMLWYPVIDNSPAGYGDATVKDRYMEISPLHNITSLTPPAIIFLGTKDSYVPVATANDFKARMEKAGVRCDLMLLEGAGHPIYEYRKGASPLRERILDAADEFLVSIKFLPAK